MNPYKFGAFILFAASSCFFSIKQRLPLSSIQGTGDYAEALQNYYEALKLETDPFDRSYILYNIGLIHASNGELEKALEYYYRAALR